MRLEHAKILTKPKFNKDILVFVLNRFGEQEKITLPIPPSKVPRKLKKKLKKQIIKVRNYYSIKLK